ncbi:MAG: NAD-binding protein [Desulfovermiculus sp.]
MQVLICGAGRIVVEVLRRLGQGWRVTVIDLNLTRLNELENEIEVVHKTVQGDASSSVVLERAGLQDQDYVLAMTADDRVNLTVAAIAKSNKVPHILSLVHDSDQIPAFHDLGVRVLDLNSLLARTLVHYLQDPRIAVTPLSLSGTEIFEVDVGATFTAIGKKVRDIEGTTWRMVGIVRDKALIFPQPDTYVQEQDRLLILGKPDLFQEVCTLLECGRPRFPFAYGQHLNLALPSRQREQKKACLQEAVYLGRNLGLESMDVVCEFAHPELDSTDQEIMEIEQHRMDARVESGLPDLCAKLNAGLAVMPGVKPSWRDFFRSPRLVKLAHRLACPLLISRGTFPYTSLLVPFDGAPESELALETASDIAKQMDAHITVMFVQEPEFLHQEPGLEQSSDDEVMHQARQMAHIHKMPMQEIVVTGNVVREVVSRSSQFSLLVLGSKTAEREWLRPHVGELLMRRAKCSVLLTVIGHIAPPAVAREVGHGV